jgi:hypothetical protein
MRSLRLPLRTLASKRSVRVRCLTSLTIHKDDDPLMVLQKHCQMFQLCDDQGQRLPKAHWTISMAITPPDMESVRVDERL